MSPSSPTPGDRPLLSRSPSVFGRGPRHLRQSYDNLVALANAQEAFKQTKRMVWRDRGEPATDLHNVQECWDHAFQGGLRAGSLAFGIRSGVNLFLLLFRIFKIPKEFRFSLIRRAIFGPESFRFAAMIGTFVTTYKFLLNALPLVNPRPSRGIDTPGRLSPPLDASNVDLENGEEMIEMRHSHGHRSHPSLSEKAVKHELYMRKQGRRWHAALAGAVAGGLGILCEADSRRLTIAQQLFVRGLQGSYNAYTTKRGIKIPFGAVIVFSVCCGQIMYGFCLRPDTIPRSYSAWIQTASKIESPSIKINRDLVNTGQFDPSDVQRLIDSHFKSTTPHNKTLLQAAKDAALADEPSYGQPFASCAQVHPWIDSCLNVPMDRFIEVFKWMVPIYGALHFIPALLFKRKAFMKDPLRMLARVLVGTGRSASFLGVFVTIYQTYFCFKNNLYASSLLPPWAKQVILSRFVWWIGGLLSGLSVFVEAERRRGELAMYVLPKGLEGAWNMARGRGWVQGGGRSGETLLCAIGMGMVMSTYQNDPQHLSGLVRRMLYQFVGPN